MFVEKLWIRSKYQILLAMALVVVLNNVTETNSAEKNVGFALHKLSSNEQVSYIAGIVEGFAYSRYLRDNPDQSGMNCIYDWYAGSTLTTGRFDKMENWFQREEGKPISVLLHERITKECGS